MSPGRMKHVSTILDEENLSGTMLKYLNTAQSAHSQLGDELGQIEYSDGTCLNGKLHTVVSRI